MCHKITRSAWIFLFYRQFILHLLHKPPCMMNSIVSSQQQYVQATVGHLCGLFCQPSSHEISCARCCSIITFHTSILCDFRSLFLQCIKIYLSRLELEANNTCVLFAKKFTREDFCPLSWERHLHLAIVRLLSWMMVVRELAERRRNWILNSIREINAIYLVHGKCHDSWSKALASRWTGEKRSEQEKNTLRMNWHGEWERNENS